MLTYVCLGTNDLARATAFYDAALAPLGLQRCITGDPDWDRVSTGWGTYEDGGARGARPLGRDPVQSTAGERGQRHHGRVPGARLATGR